MDLHERFESFNDEFMKFERVEKKRCNRADLHAFLLLNEMFPPKYPGKDIVCGSSHDEIWLDVDKEQLEPCSDEVLIELIRCGVRYDEENGICMFT